MERMIGTGVAIAFMIGTAQAHDPDRPDLDNWYANLHRQGFAKCCNKTDCHRTDAEIRSDSLGHSHWWARVGQPDYSHDDTGRNPTWKLGAWVEIPDDIIVRDDKGKPIPNPEGEAVICHVVGSGVVDRTHLYCFVPPWQG